MMKVFLAALFALAPLANLRAGDIEPVEFYLLAALPLGAMLSWRRGRPLAVPRESIAANFCKTAESFEAEKRSRISA